MGIFGTKTRPEDLSGPHFHKLADTSDGVPRVKGFDRRGRETLLDANTGKIRPYPLLGVTTVGDLPKRCVVPMKYVLAARAEGWARLDGETRVTKPATPPDHPSPKDHTFIHANTITFLLLGDSGPEEIVYRVTKQPDKVGEGGLAVVNWDYTLEREN